MGSDGSTTPAARFRSAEGRRWRAARLLGIAVAGTGFHVELVEARNGARRTLDAAVWQIEVAEGRRWVSVERWAGGTPSLAGLT